MSLHSFQPQPGAQENGQAARWQEHSRSLCGNPGMVAVSRWFAESFLSHQQLAPRAASVFASQQKWLMAHLAASLYFRSTANKGERLTLQHYIRAALQHRVASRNTARDFFLELIKYNFSASEVHFREVLTSTVTELSAHPTPETMVNLMGWYQVHLRGLDLLDGRDRHATFSKDTLRYMTIMEPLIADGFLTCPDIRSPGQAYGLFSWVDEGGFLMDRFISGIDPAADLTADTIPTDIASVAEIAQGLNISRVHAARVIGRAEAIGVVSWNGSRGRSRMWIARALHEEYVYFQALKMVIIDVAFKAVPDVSMPRDGPP
ncbi:MAG: hypothetical protein RLZZ444_4431 [Pseudomonadota bacterium]|jgi:hypothetical protein